MQKLEPYLPHSFPVWSYPKANRGTISLASCEEKKLCTCPYLRPWPNSEGPSMTRNATTCYRRVAASTTCQGLLNQLANSQVSWSRLSSMPSQPPRGTCRVAALSDHLHQKQHF